VQNLPYNVEFKPCLLRAQLNGFSKLLGGDDWPKDCGIFGVKYFGKYSFQGVFLYGGRVYCTTTGHPDEWMNRTRSEALGNVENRAKTESRRTMKSPARPGWPYE